MATVNVPPSDRVLTDVGFGPVHRNGVSFHPSYERILNVSVFTCNLTKSIRYASPVL